MSHNLIEQIKRHEGMTPHAYKDSLGYLTIGFGRLIDPDLGGGISEREATLMLLNDIERAQADLETFFPMALRVSLIRYEVLVNMCFNMGISRLRSFKKMWAAIEAGDFDAAAKEMLDSRWARQVKSRADELAEQMRTGAPE